MSDSGLILGAEAHATVAAGYGRAGDWGRVQEALDRWGSPYCWQYLLLLELPPLLLLLLLLLPLLLRVPLLRARSADIRLDDGDLMAIMVGCCHGGLEQEARDQLLPALPRRAGFFQVRGCREQM